MILIVAGTQDGRKLAEALSGRGHEVVVSVVSEYGGRLAETSGAVVVCGAKNEIGLIKLIEENNVQLLIDATHPYAVIISDHCRKAADQKGILYVRYERSEQELPLYDKMHTASDYAQGALLAGSIGGTVFLTIGSKQLPVFANEPLLKETRVVCRVLPDSAVIASCRELGFLPRDIIAAQGPFSVALNRAMFEEINANVIVTKNSGDVGGCDSKIQAAMDMGIHIVVVARPTEVRKDFLIIRDIPTAIEKIEKMWEVVK